MRWNTDLRGRNISSSLLFFSLPFTSLRFFNCFFFSPLVSKKTDNRKYKNNLQRIKVNRFVNTFVSSPKASRSSPTPLPACLGSVRGALKVSSVRSSDGVQCSSSDPGVQEEEGEEEQRQTLWGKLEEELEEEWEEPEEEEEMMGRTKRGDLHCDQSFL